MTHTEENETSILQLSEHLPGLYGFLSNNHGSVENGSLQQKCVAQRASFTGRDADLLALPSGGSTCLHLETESEQTHAADADGCLGIEDYIIIIYIYNYICSLILLRWLDTWGSDQGGFAVKIFFF